MNCLLVLNIKKNYNTYSKYLITKYRENGDIIIWCSSIILQSNNITKEFTTIYNNEYILDLIKNNNINNITILSNKPQDNSLDNLLNDLIKLTYKNSNFSIFTINNI